VKVAGSIDDVIKPFAVIRGFPEPNPANQAATTWGCLGQQVLIVMPENKITLIITYIISDNVRY
jgi:hypothetical protein